MTAKEILESGREDVERVFGLAAGAYKSVTGAKENVVFGNVNMATWLKAACLAKLSESYWHYNGKIFECRFSSLEELELKLAACA